MPRPRRPGAPEPKRRSRKGCWPCKARKVKCGEEKPSCLNCERVNEKCDYSIRLNWGGRARRPSSVDSPGACSWSSGQSGQFLTLDLSPPDPMKEEPDTMNWATGLGGSAPEQTTEPFLWDASLGGELALATSCPRDFHNANSPGQSINANGVSDGVSVDWRHSSPGQSPQMTTAIPTAMPGYAPSVPHSVEPIAYPSPADTTSSPGSFAAFNFSPAPAGRPISFQQRMDVSQHRSPPELESPGQQTDFSHYSSSVNATSLYGDFAPCSPDATGPSPRKTSLYSSPRDLQEVSSLASVSVPSEDIFAKAMNGQLTGGSPREPRKSSAHHKCSSFSQVDDVSSSEKKWHAYLTRVTDNYGFDCGRPDLDLNKNDDHSAIDVNVSGSLDLISNGDKNSPAASSCSLGVCGLDGAKYAYYSSPVPINIPRYLSPLPPSLVKNPINLMYFHHFLNHTAKMLVPHDCAENPFISVLPTMAIGDSNLLNLMLAYSASHRARYLERPEPSNRIAHWVSNVFPTLRVALEDPHEKVTDNHLAAAIMLLSLKIVSPSTFEVPIPWQSHLKLARDLFNARSTQMAYPGNRVGAFLTRWLGYLDIMGALSCRHSDPPSLAYHSLLSTCSAAAGDDEFGVDCFTGFTPRTGLFLARLGRLVHQCDNERFTELGTFISDWTPSLDVVVEAESLLADFEVLQTNAHADGSHLLETDSRDIFAIDRAIRYAGLIHLHRRVLNTPSLEPAVTGALEELMSALADIRQGAATDAGALFPLFTAGCESLDEQRRMEIQERFEIIEKTGMKQMQNARALMQRCWKEELPWIALARGEFLG